MHYTIFEMEVTPAPKRVLLIKIQVSVLDLRNQEGGLERK